MTRPADHRRARVRRLSAKRPRTTEPITVTPRYRPRPGGEPC